jgi:hypothetical protein
MSVRVSRQSMNCLQVMGFVGQQPWCGNPPRQTNSLSFFCAFPPFVEPQLDRDALFLVVDGIRPGTTSLRCCPGGLLDPDDTVKRRQDILKAAVRWCWCVSWLFS